MYWIAILQIGTSVIAAMTAIQLTPEIKRELKEKWQEESWLIDRLVEVQRCTIERPLEILDNIRIGSVLLKYKISKAIEKYILIGGFALIVSFLVKLIIWLAH